MLVESRPLTDDVVRNVVLTWYRGTNEHLPAERIEQYLSSDVEMRYPNVKQPLIGRDQFENWYADVLNKYFDETHAVEKCDVLIDGDTAIATVHLRWERRAWVAGSARSEYQAYLSRQVFNVVRRSDGRMEITRKIVETFDSTLPKYSIGQ